MLENLKNEARRLGKPAWRPMLQYIAQLHEKAIRPPEYPFKYPWEEIGPGYCYSPAFGHWDIVHQILDSIPVESKHAKEQLYNNLCAQREDGFLPGSIYKREGAITWSDIQGHPPVWPVAVQDYCVQHKNNDLIEVCYEPLIKQIYWFEKNRSAEGTGFFYNDILVRKWESGVDDGVRFDDIATGAYACIDATCHVFQLYRFAEHWAKVLQKEEHIYAEKADKLQAFIQKDLYDPVDGFFYDSWAIKEPQKRHAAFEGMWPVVVGAATQEQANRVINEHLLNPARFFTKHPITTVGVEDRLFEMRLWRGATWNSMTYWAARGCIRYGQKDAGAELLEKALDATATQFDATGTIWEFYHPSIGNQNEVKRKPYTPFNNPCRDYLGHNPLIAMARMWESVSRVKENKIKGV